MSKLKYKTGDVILQCEPISFILDASKKEFLCDYCFSYSDGLKKCGLCHSFFYCNKSCQTQDWKKHHKRECNLYQKSLKDNIYMGSTIDRFVLRTYLKVTSNDSSLASKHFITHENSFRSFDDLMDHSAEILKDEKRCNELTLLKGVLKKLDFCFDDKILNSTYGKIMVNGFELGVESNGVGFGLFIEASIFDHSCDPNAANVFDNKKDHLCQVRALRDIEEGEPIYISYLSLKMTRSERIKLLENNYYFRCNCIKCNEESGDSLDLAIVEADSLMMKYNLLSDGDANELQILLQVHPILEQIYAGYHPDFTLELLRLVKAMKFSYGETVIRRSDFKKFWNKMMKHVQVTHGLDHSFYQDFVRSF